MSKTTYWRRIGDWSSDVCSSDLANPLDPWHERLEAHFKALAETRATKGLPVIALEHGLNVAEPDTLAGLLRASVWKWERLSKYWLPWTSSEERRGGKDGASTCVSGWSASNKKKKKETIQR